MSDIYIGLMSGTSLDAIDAVAVRFDSDRPLLIASHTAEWPLELKRKIQQLCQPGHDEIGLMAEIDPAIAYATAETVNALLKNQDLLQTKSKPLAVMDKP